MRRLYEKKDHLIKRNPNLTDREKQEIIELLGKHPSYENRVDWNKSNSLTYEDFMSVLRPLYLNDLDPRGLVEGQDYDILYESEDEVLYSVYTYDASRILASNNVVPKIWTEIPDWCGEEEFTDEAHAFGHFDFEHGDMKPGAKWCISMQTSDKYWESYKEDFLFFFWFRDGEYIPDPNKKIAIGVDKKTGKVALKYNGADTDINSELSSYIEEVIYGVFKEDREKEKQRILSNLILNSSTNRYDYEGNLKSTEISYFVSEDKKGFTLDFGVIKGNFDCSALNLISLKGAPQKVGGDFICSYDNLTSLKGAPQEVGGIFSCSYNQLTSLEGAPREVGKNFYCNNNGLTSLEGAPKEVGKGFYCHSNILTSLEGAPQIVGRDFYCYNNELTSLKGSPKYVGWNFDCSWNKLTSLEGAPQKVDGGFTCSNNFSLHSLEGIGEVKGKIYKDF